MAAARQESSGVHSVETERQTRRRILALDYGRKRIGLAVSDELQLTAQPLRTLTRKNRAEDIRRLRAICREEGIGRIVVGYPVHITGEPGTMAEEAARFASRLQKELGIEVELLDERLTSWEAERTVAATGRASGRTSIDDIAAAILLRDYLERRPSAPAAQSAIPEKV